MYRNTTRFAVYFILALDCPLPVLHAIFMMQVARFAEYWMGVAAKVGDKWLVDIAIARGARDWNHGMYNAALGGHLDLVKFFITFGTNDWDMGMVRAIQGMRNDRASRGRRLIDFFIKKGANYWNWYMIEAATEGQTDLVHFFINAAKDRGVIMTPTDWKYGLKYASLIKHDHAARDQLVKFFKHELNMFFAYKNTFLKTEMHDSCIVQSWFREVLHFRMWCLSALMRCTLQHTCACYPNRQSLCKCTRR